MPTFTRQQALAELDAHNAALLIQIANETTHDDTPLKTTSNVTLAGDQRRLRGIPAIARGVTGHIPGTRP